MRLAFIGGGVMAEAMIAGVLRQGVAQASDVAVGEPLESRRTLLTERYQVQANPDNVHVIDGADITVLAIKPQQLAEVLGELRGKVKKGHTVASIVAGTRMDTLARGLEHDAIIRIMPNTPAQVGAGMTLWAAAPLVDEATKERVRAILQTLGQELYVDEEKYLDMATALSASGPAYVFLFLESLADAGVYLGMPRDTARTLAVQTVLGSTLMAKETGEHFAELRNRVTSPGGTTAEALLRLEEGGFRAAVIQAVAAAYAKSRSLGEKP